MRPTLRTISRTDLVPEAHLVSADWTPPASIEWAPSGSSRINATMGKTAWEGTVITAPRDVEKLDKQLQRLLAEARDGKRSRPFIDFDHKGEQAAAIPVRFTWNDGIRLEVEWTEAGLAALRGRTYSYFSPEFILGDDSHPEALPTPGPIGALVNTPAFQRIARLAATHNDDTKMPKLIETLVAAGYVPDGVTDEEKAATHFADNIKAANKAKEENATLRAELGTMQRRQKEADDARKAEVEAEVDQAIKAGHCDPETREIVVTAILEDPEKGRKLIKGGAQRKSAATSEKPVRAGLGYGSVTEEEDRIRAEQNPDKRRIMRCDWYTREQSRHIRAANTIDAALIQPIAAEPIITKLGAALAPLNALTLKVVGTPTAPQLPVIVNVVSAPAASVLKNATNFNQTFTVMAAKTVTPDQYTMPWNLTNRNIQDGLDMMSAAEANAQALAEAIWTAAIATIDATNFPGTQVTSKISEWSTKGVKSAFAVIANGRVRNMVLAPEIFAEIMHTDSKSFTLTPAQQGAGAYGFNGIWFANLWARATSPVAGLKGFVCDPQAIAAVIAPPLLAPGAAAAGLTSTNITAPGIGITVQFNTWFSTDSRTPQMSYDVIFGSSVGDNTAGHLVIPAAEVLVAEDESAPAASTASTASTKK